MGTTWLAGFSANQPAAEECNQPNFYQTTSSSGQHEPNSAAIVVVMVTNSTVSKRTSSNRARLRIWAVHC